MKNNNRQKQNYSIYGINNSYELLQSNKIAIISIFLSKQSKAFKEKKIKNHIARFKEKVILFEKKDFNKKFRLIRSQGIVITFKLSFMPDSLFQSKQAAIALDESLKSSAPFSLNVHYNAPHAPWGREHHPKDLFDDYYDNCPFDSLPNEDIHPDQLNKEPGAATIGDTPENRRSALSGYFAAITAMDQNIGRLIDWLEDNNLRENTLVIFNADNGMNMGHHGMWGKGNAIYPPNMYDTSVKVPALISRPNHVPQGLVCSDLLSQYDFMPTILSYVGSQNPHKDSLPGRDFSPILNGGQMGEDAAVFVLDEYGPTRMIRTHTWKYIHRYPDGPSEMYNLEEDPGITWSYPSIVFIDKKAHVLYYERPGTRPEDRHISLKMNRFSIKSVSQ